MTRRAARYARWSDHPTDREPEGEARSSFAKFLSPASLAAIEGRLEAEPGDLLLVVADRPTVVSDSLGL